LRPGEPVFERLRDLVLARCGGEARRGAIFVDPEAHRPYALHLATVTVVRRADPAFAEFAQRAILETRLVAMRRERDGEIAIMSPEQWFVLRVGRAAALTEYAPLARQSASDEAVLGAREFLTGVEGAQRVASLRAELEGTLAERVGAVTRGYDLEEAELFEWRRRRTEEAKRGVDGAQQELALIKERQRRLREERERTLEALRREPELIEVGDVELLAHALVVPSDDPHDVAQRDERIEEIAMTWARAYEEARGATVVDVSTSEAARAAGLPEWPGFDLLSRRPDGSERCIEVKGRAAVGSVELSENEVVRAINLRDRYWLYAVFRCGSAEPMVYPVRDPFGVLVKRGPGGIVFEAESIVQQSAVEPHQEGRG